MLCPMQLLLLVAKLVLVSTCSNVGPSHHEFSCNGDGRCGEQRGTRRRTGDSTVAAEASQFALARMIGDASKSRIIHVEQIVSSII